MKFRNYLKFVALYYFLSGVVRQCGTRRQGKDEKKEGLNEPLKYRVSFNFEFPFETSRIYTCTA